MSIKVQLDGGDFFLELDNTNTYFIHFTSAVINMVFWPDKCLVIK